MLEQVWNELWPILQVCRDIFTWFFHAEERIAIMLDARAWPNWQQIPILTLINILIITWEVLMFSGINWLLRLLKCFKINIKEPKTPNFVLFITRGKPIGILELAILAFIPLCQKIGTFVYTTQRKYFGIKGYIALCCGGALRLAIVAYLPKDALWYMIAGMLLLRVFTWWFENGYHRANGK